MIQLSSLTNRIARATLLVATFGFSACIPLPNGKTYQTKLVTAKRGANELVSYDGTSCEVSRDEFGRIGIGEKHRCVWGSQPTTGARPRTP